MRLFLIADKTNLAENAQGISAGMRPKKQDFLLGLSRKISTWLRRPLVLLSLTVFTNVMMVVVTVVWLYLQQNVISAEWRTARTLTCVHLDYNGLYFTYLPPQKGIGGKNFIRVTEVELQHGKTAIERNLTKMSTRLVLPGIAIWKTSAPQDYVRWIVRTRFGFLLLLCVLLRIGLLTLKRFNETETLS